MGMFSWCCKGCGHEIHEGELVRMNGCVGIYDGYGRAGGFDYQGASGEPSCWHECCYKNATTEQKLDDSSSKYASNQGFGADGMATRGVSAYGNAEASSPKQGKRGL